MPKVVAPILVIALGFIGSVALVRSKTPVETVSPVTLDPLVRVVSARVTEVPFTVSAQGTVVPRTETTLAAQVAAQVVAVSPRLETGSFFERGEVLVRLDARDYELEAERASARVAQAELRLAQQKAEARVAAEEWKELGEGEPDPLVLRQPQMAEAQAMLDAAEAELGMARLALERCAIRAPFTGRVHRKIVDVGQYLVPGQEIATLHAIDYAEVRLPVSDHKLAYLDLPVAWDNNGAKGPAVTLSAEFSGRRNSWSGRIVRAEGELDQRSRMMHLVARVEDPYRRLRPGGTPLAVGLFVEAEVAGRTVRGIVVPRSALRDDGQLLVVDDEERLRRREVDVLRIEKDVAVIGGGLEEGERVCVSLLDVVVDGMPVRVTEVDGEAGARASESEASGKSAAPDVESTSIQEGSTVIAAAPDIEPPAAQRTPAHLHAVDSLDADAGAVFAVSVGGDFSYSTSTLETPARFVIDLVTVVKSSKFPAVGIDSGPVERIRVGQYQSEPEPIARLVFDLRVASDPLVERVDSGLLVSF